MSPPFADRFLERISAQPLMGFAMDEEPEKLTVRIPTATAMLGLSRSKFYDLMDGGEIATIKVGRVRLVILQSLHDYVKRHLQR